MKIQFTNCRLLLISFILSSAIAARAQGTVTFDAHPNWDGTNYYELGMQFRVLIPQGSSYDDMGIVPPLTYQGVPQDSTSFMGWFRQNNPYDYVSLSLTNGNTFGLTSVWLADPTSPSPAPFSISFVGFLAGGSTVTNTFITPGNGATTFQNYLFNSAFASGLTSVDIFASRWAMDNLVFIVPEPAAISFLLLGSGVFIYVRHRCKKH